MDRLDFRRAGPLSAWEPKVKRGGVIAGRDINLAGVRRADDEAYPGRWRQWEWNWFVGPRSSGRVSQPAG